MYEISRLDINNTICVIKDASARETLAEALQRLDTADTKIDDLFQKELPTITALDALLSALGLEIVDGKLNCRYADEESDAS